jgi:hypothetical protein
MVMLRDTAKDKCLPKPIHLDRLKIAYVRVSNPSPYFVDSVVTHQFVTPEDT